MKSYLVETSVIIDYLKGREDARILLRSLEGNLTSSYFCLSELYEGVRRVREPKKHESAVLSYFASLTFVYGLDIRIAKKFGEVRAALKKEGNVIEDIDLFLAATCLAYDLILLTYNKKHFSRINGLEMV